MNVIYFNEVLSYMTHILYYKAFWGNSITFEDHVK